MVKLFWQLTKFTEIFRRNWHVFRKVGAFLRNFKKFLTNKIGQTNILKVSLKASMKTTERYSVEICSDTGREEKMVWILMHKFIRDTRSQEGIESKIAR